MKAVFFFYIYKGGEFLVNKLKVSENEILISVFLFNFGVLSVIRGLYFAMMPKHVALDFDFYRELSGYMNLTNWGILLTISGLLFIIAIFLYSYKNYNRVYEYLLIIGGILGGFIYLVLCAYAIKYSLTLVTPLQLLTLSSCYYAVAITEVMAICRKKTI